MLAFSNCAVRATSTYQIEVDDDDDDDGGGGGEKVNYNDFESGRKKIVKYTNMEK